MASPAADENFHEGAIRAEFKPPVKQLLRWVASDIVTARVRTPHGKIDDAGAQPADDGVLQPGEIGGRVAIPDPRVLTTNVRDRARKDKAIGRINRRHAVVGQLLEQNGIGIHERNGIFTLVSAVNFVTDDPHIDKHVQIGLKPVILAGGLQTDGRIIRTGVKQPVIRVGLIIKSAPAQIRGSKPSD